MPLLKAAHTERRDARLSAKAARAAERVYTAGILCSKRFIARGGNVKGCDRARQAFHLRLDWDTVS